MQNNNTIYNSLTNRLKKTYAKQVNYNLFYYLFRTLTMISILFVLFSAIEFFANGNTDFRTTLFYTYIGLSVGILGINYINFNKKLLKNENDKIIKTSNKVGQYFPEIRDKLTNAIQIYKQATTTSGVSVDLVNSELNAIAEYTNSYNFNEIIEQKKYKKFIIAFILLSFISFLTVGISDFALNPSASRLINYNKSYVPPPNFTLKINDLKTNVLRGDDVELIINSNGNSPEKITIFVKEDGQKEFDKFILERKVNVYSYKISSIKNSISFYGSTNWYNTNVQTKLGRVTVSERPAIKRLSGIVSFPNYTGEKSKNFDINNADIVAINGSRVRFNLETNKNIAKAMMIFTTENSTIDSTGIVSETVVKSDTFNLNTKLNKADYTHTIRKSGYYYFKLIDSNGIDNENPIKYSIIATEDNHPKISLISPTDNIQLSENALIQIDAEIYDDFGFSKMKLHYKLNKSNFTAPDKNYSSIDINIKKNEKNQIASYIWDLNRLGITPEDEYEFYLEVFDNDIVNGPKSAKTRVLTLRLPSLEEVIESAEQAQEEIEKDLSEVLKEAQELRKDMEELKQDLRKDFKKPEMNYEQKKKAEDLANKQKQVAENVNKLQEKINQTAREMHENKVLSPETLEKFMKLQELLKQVDIPQLKKMQEQLNKELKNMTPQEMQKALEDMKFDEEQFQKSIERSMKILERMKAEQKTDAIKKMGEKLEKDLENLQKQTKEADPSDKKNNENLAKKQDDLQKDLDNLENQLKDLENLMKNQENMPMDKMSEAQQELNKEQTQSEMQEAEKNLQQGNKQQAQQNQQSAKQNMKKFNQKMSELKQEMQNQVSRETLNTMKKAVQDMLEMSKQQEELKNQTNASNYNSSQLPEINNQQGKMKEALQRVAKSLSELSEKSFAVTPEMGKDIGQALNEMQNAMNQLAERNTPQAGKSQQQSMAKMNSAIGKMQGALGAMQGQGQGKGQGQGQGQGQGGSSPGMGSSPGGMGFSQQLQQAAAQQQMINNSLKQMMQNGSNQGQQNGQGSDKSQLQKQAEYGRLQNEQGNAKKSIEELAEEQKKFQKQGGKKEIDLEQIAKEMKEVMADMQSGNITQETIERQEKILSKLLDANRSTNERDYEKKREAKSGTQYSQNSPEALKLKEYLKQLSEDKLKQSLKMGYTKDMENLIRKYFEDLKQNSN